VSKLKKAGSYDGDLRGLPIDGPVKRERPEREGPEPNPQIAPVAKGTEKGLTPQIPPFDPLALAAPAPSASFDGLDFANWGAGHPPDTNGDVGPTYYIQTVNTSIGVYDKATGTRVAAFTFDTFMSQGNFGNLCDTDNFGDPVVLYDTFEDRWVITDFAFQLDGSGNVVNPPGSFQCFAVSKTGDPVNGGWNYYSINTTGGLGDYPKFGIWPDGIYMSVNMFGYAASAPYQNPRVYALNKAQMYAGAPTVQVFSFDAPSNDFTILPSNARLQTGTPPTGRPNIYVSTEVFLNGLTVYKFHVDWDHPSLSTFTGPDTQLAPTCWPNANPANASTPGNTLDTLAIRAMVQNQYSNIGGAESLWVAHTVNRGEFTLATCGGTNTNNAATRWYQLNVTGGTVAANVIQGQTFDPDGANTSFRFMPSVAVDKLGNMAIGYSKSNATTNPQMKYAGRLVGDPVNTITQTEQTLIDGTGTQTGSCGGNCHRWGDYSAMTLDPNGCTFWYTNEYYATSGLNDLTRIGAFSYPSCTAFSNNGGLQGTVKSAVTNQPLQGATVSLGSRLTTTDASGHYSFASLPHGVYQSESAALGGYLAGTASNISISDGIVATRDFSLSAANDSSCFTDTTQSDFQTGTLNNTDASASPGNVTLAVPILETADQVSSPAALSTTNNLSATTWTGQTFRAGITGNLTKMQIGLGLASGTSGTITVEIRNLNGTNPGTTVLATSTAGPVTNVGTAALYTVTFSTPASVVSGTSYSVVLRNSIGNTVFGVRGTTAGGSTLANGQVFTTVNSGTTWTGVAADLLFTTFVTPPIVYSPSGDFVSGLKDSNPALPGTTTWGAINWTATVPANTTLRIQAAASDSQYGPFNFVGPNGTAATFFTNGGSLAQFNGKRYLKYKVLMTTTDGTVTPTLNDIATCNTNPRVWTGAVSTDWNNPANWSSSGVPGSSDAATLPSTGVLNNPASGVNVSVGTLNLGQGRIVDLGANSLTVSNCSTSAITGGDVTSFVKGRLIRCINSAGPYVFPVGTTAGFAPVTLGGMVGSGTFTVNPVDGVLTGTNPTQSLTRFWHLTPAGGVTQADITLNYQNSDVPVGANEAAFSFIRRNGGGDTSAPPSTFNTTTNTFTINGVTSFSSWTLGTLLAPTAANVSVAGRVIDPSGAAIPNAIVNIADGSGSSRSVRTNPFGYFSFDGVTAGSTYIVSVRAKGYQFTPRVVSVVDEIAGLDFIAQP